MFLSTKEENAFSVVGLKLEAWRVRVRLIRQKGRVVVSFVLSSSVFGWTWIDRGPENLNQSRETEAHRLVNAHLDRVSVRLLAGMMAAVERRRRKTQELQHLDARLHELPRLPAEIGSWQIPMI